jgi:hypothetical protein
MQLGCYHNHNARPSTNQSEQGHCPQACQDLSEEQRETRHGQTESEIWLVNWEQQGSSKDDQINPNYVKMAEELKTGNMSTPGIRIEPTDKIWIKYMDNLARQELEDPNRHTPQWKSTLGKHIRDKVHFDMQPTDLQNDIKGTGNCELCNRQVDLIIPRTSSTRDNT